jgi:hypothetical protein
MMRRGAHAAIGTALFLVVAPGTVAGLIPWLLSRWRMGEPFLGFMGLRWIGGALIVAGIPPLLDSLRRFARQGLGTPAPLYPTNRRDRDRPLSPRAQFDLCRRCGRDFGQALLLASRALLIWGAIVCL